MSKVLRNTPAVIVGMLLILSAARASEFRGLYVDAWHPGFKSHAEVAQMVNAAKAANFNALIVQVRKRGDAYYNSHVEPKANDIAPDYDPLADIVRQGHAQGLEVHAWLSVYDVARRSYADLPAKHIARAHPEWLMLDQEGRVTLDAEQIYVDPGVPDVRRHFVSLVTDVLNNYQVDGIHLDPNYPNRQCGYNPTSVSRFNQELSRSGLPEDDDAQWSQWRRDQVTTLVSDVKTAIASIRPSVKLSVAGMTTPDIASRAYLQDYDAWTTGGLVDFVVPMLYIMTDKMPEVASSALSAAHGRHVYVGIGAFYISPELATKHVQDARTAGAPGVVMYSYHYLGPNSPDPNCARLSSLAGSVFAQPADIPAMPWKQ